VGAAGAIGRGNAGGNPVAVWDSRRARVLLHFVRGEKRAGDCVPGDSNWETVSADGGATWSAPRDISFFLGPHAGALPGPGSGGLEVRATGRLVFNAHFETAERGDGAVVVYHSDDGGATYQLARSPPFAHMDESTMAEAAGGELVISMRNDPRTSGCGAADDPACQVRAVARSADGGETWSNVSFDAALPDPVCEGSLGLIGNTTIFFNAAMHHMRSMPTLRFSHDGGRTWDRSELLADSFAGYSSIVNGAISGAAAGVVEGGVLWAGCTHPVPLRLWCTPVELLHGTWWTVQFTRFAV
jgi:sialidase-1